VDQTNQPVTNGIRFKSEPGLIRDKSERQVGYIFQEYLSNKPTLHDVQNPYDHFEEIPDGPHLHVKRLLRRFDFLHKVVPGPPSRKPYSTVLPLERCTEDSVPFKFVQVGLLIPSIMHHVSLYLVAKTLSETLLRDVDISDLSLIVTAICASSANEASNYQRLEFLGDSILKTCVGSQEQAAFLFPSISWSFLGDAANSYNSFCMVLIFYVDVCSIDGKLPSLARGVPFCQERSHSLELSTLKSCYRSWFGLFHYHQEILESQMETVVYRRFAGPVSW